MSRLSNLFAHVLKAAADEQVDLLADHHVVRIERIVSTGQASPPGFWYDQDDGEWIAVLQGEAKLRFEDPDDAVRLKPGDFFDIRAHRRHRVEWTTPHEPTIWLAVYYSSRVE